MSRGRILTGGMRETDVLMRGEVFEEEMGAM